MQGDSADEDLAMCSSLFGEMGVKPIVKPIRNITPDDLRQHNVILLGLPFQNVAVAELIVTGISTSKVGQTGALSWVPV